MMVRMPLDLRDRIKAAADISGRSQNSEIVATLSDKYPAPRRDVKLVDLMEVAIKLFDKDIKRFEGNPNLQEAPQTMRHQMIGLLERYIQAETDRDISEITVAVSEILIEFATNAKRRLSGQSPDDQ